LSQRTKYKRILLKFSGEFLSSDKEHNLSIDSINRIIQEIKPLIKLKLQIGLVLGAGNIMRGNITRQKESSSKTFTQVEADKAGMLGTVINSILFSDILSQHHIKNKVFSTIYIDFIESFNAISAKTSLQNGYVNIYAGGTSNSFVTTDTAAVLKAIETNCSLLIKATKVDGVYDKDPVKYKHAKFYKKISYIKAIEKDLKVMDLTAMSLAMENQLPIVVLNFFKKNNLVNFIQGKDIGTIIN